ncbi:hypothetical protein C4D60_Mb10t06450 [Musa balbisiana]|uniref:Uncharacterized protein n=1 Tax=Musa balbisiana TaxID=52838 RepID=A0A4S8IV45_MUSBA|nr:hypothetical protein C4D60_Mb10t06450 [Musa balbisiana]
MRGQPAASAPRPLGPMRSKQPAASAPRPLGPSAPCVDSPLPRPLGPSATACPRAPRPQLARGHTCAASPPPVSCSSATCCPRPHFRGLPACVVFLGSMAFETHLRGLPACVVLLDPMTRDTPARPARLRRAPWLHVARDHACAACPPAPCSSVARCPRPHLRGLPACVVFLGSMAFETHLRCLPACVLLLDPMTRDTPTGQPACVVLLGYMLPETTPARPGACAVFLGRHRDHACAACPPAPCSSVARCPRPHLRGQPACIVLLGSSAACLPETTPTRPARLRRVPRLHVARDHTCAASPPASCSSAPCSPRPHSRGQPT